MDFPDDEPVGKLHWKTRFLAEWAGGQPFVWLDDEIREADRSWVQEYYPGVALLHRVDPSAGLTEADFAAVREWLTGL